MHCFLGLAGSDPSPTPGLRCRHRLMRQLLYLYLLLAGRRYLHKRGSVALGRAGVARRQLRASARRASHLRDRKGPRVGDSSLGAMVYR